MQQIITFIQEAPAAAAFVAVSVGSLTFIGIRLFGAGLLKHFIKYGKK
ncbi:hypothetical protein [Chitinophaga lutea]|nr:hypothetical protein [Chitinophaga lutea]